MGEYTKIILNEMCRRVGTNDNIDFKRNDWYTDYTWTQEQENEFVDWLTDYLYNNRDARQELMVFSHKDKKRCKGAAREFSANYGWKLKTPTNG